MGAPNPFDQFDANSPDAPPAAAPATTAQGANPFDQFGSQSHHYQVKAPNGHVYEFDAPADATPQQLDALTRQAAGYNKSYPVTAQQPSIGQQLWDATKNDVAGIAQGAAAIPDAAAEAVGKIFSTIPNLISHGLRAAGHTDAANWVQNTLTHNLANPVQIGHEIEKASPTPDSTSAHVARFVGNLAGGAAVLPSSVLDAAAAKLVGEAPRIATAAAPAAEAATAPDYADLARDLNVRRTPATNSGTGVATVVQSGLGALPGGAPVAAAADREVGDLGAAAKNVAESVGTVSDRQGAGEALAQGAQSYKQTSGVQGNGLYAQRDALMGGQTAPVVLNNFDSAISDLNRQFPGSPAIQQLREHPVIRQVTDAFEGSPQREATLGEATEALSHVRGVLRNLSVNNSATPVVTARVSKVEQALESDVMDAAKAADIANGRVPGEPGSAVKAQQDADSFWADRAAALNGSLKKPLQSATDDTKMSGEAVYNQVAGDMDQKSGNLARLRDTWFRLPDEAKSTFAATKIDDLGRATPGNQNDLGDAWSFNTFLTNFNKLSPQARNIVFGAQSDAQLAKIATYANRLRQLDKARNFSNTAQKYFAGAFMATVGGAVMHGDLGGAAEAAAAIPATWGGAKLLLSTPAMRDWTAQALSALNTGNETALKVLTKRLGVIAGAQPAIANQATGLQKAILSAANDNVRSLAASGRQQNPQPKAQQAQ